MWYWRQSLSAIVIKSFDDVRSRKLLALRAAIVGWTGFFIFFLVFFVPLSTLGQWLFVRGLGDIRAWWPNVRVASLVVAPLGLASIGWLVARTHGRAMVLMFIATVVVWGIVTFPMDDVNPLHGWVSVRDVLVAGTLHFLVAPIAILLGGIFGASAHNQTGVAS
jgi:hypothetical protein